MNRKPFRKRRRKMLKLLTGTRGNEERSKEWNLGTAIPEAETEKRVSPHEGEKLCGWELGLKPVKGVDRVVRFAGGIGCIGEGDGEVRQAADRKLSHGDAIFEAGGRAERLEGLRAYGREQNCVEMQKGLSRTRDAEVSHMRRIEAAAEESDSTTVGGGGMHFTMVSLF